jgi:hypothetical protein
MTDTAVLFAALSSAALAAPCFYSAVIMAREDFARDQDRKPAARFRLPVAFRRVGGLRFVKLHRLTVSWSVSRSFRPF